jgi:hypothetical protein
MLAADLQQLRVGMSGYKVAQSKFHGMRRSAKEKKCAFKSPVLLMTYRLAYPYDAVRSNDFPRRGLRLGKKIPC